MRWAGLAGAIAVAGILLLPTTPAAAEPPFRVPTQITDRAGALTGGDQADVQAAIDQLSAEDNVDLYVVYVDTFDDPTDSEQWTTQTAELSSLVPGSLVVEAHRLTGKLYLHVLDVRQSGGIEAARQSVLDQEERVLRAFASDDELEAAGLGRRA